MAGSGADIADFAPDPTISALKRLTTTPREGYKDKVMFRRGAREGR
jgi:hypothetical protein